MARAHSTFFSLVAPSTSHTPTPPFIPASSLAPSRPLKITRRKNYLRPKILKTLIPKPPIVPLPPQEPSPPPETATPVPCPESTEENELLSVEVPSEETHGEDEAADATEEAEDLEDLQVSEATIQPKDFFGKVSASDIFKFCGVCFLGTIVYQTILSVFFIMNYDSRPKDGNLEVNGSEKRDLSLRGNGIGSNVIHVMGQVMKEKKIEEIKSMAKEARRIERMEKKELEEEEEEEEDVDYESDDDNLSYGSSPKPGIEREIAARLMKLQNKINGDKHTSASGVARNGNKNANQGNEQLTFKKKLKYKSPSIKATKTPKGFPGTPDRRAPDAKNRNSEVRRKAVSDAIDHAQISHEDKPVTEQDEKIQGSISSIPLKESGESVAQESKAILNNEKDLERNLETPKSGVNTTNTNNGNSHAGRGRRRNKRAL
ncbi:hypothetical protein PIB30_005115 [Stylosanthes scabra]|uniref:Uncharacterized protein n=1 Tax=Stylosanthes scabra TaxID=79078 RepID=A0ABU6Q4X6_9FABA|nr:hypothetical protein [Stylosanthes scabra]